MSVSLLDLSQVLASLCPAWTPESLTALWRHVLIQHFARPEGVTEACLSSAPWTDDPATTGLLIEDAGVWKPELTEFRPAVLIRAQDQQGLQVGVGNLMMGGNPPAGDYAILFRGAHTFFCIAREHAESRRLAWEVARQVFCFTPVIVEHLANIVRVSPPTVAATGVLEEARQHFATPVSLAYAYSMSWSVAEAPATPAKKIDFTLGA